MAWLCAYLIVSCILATVWLAVRIGVAIPGLWQTSSQFNSTEDWAPTNLALPAFDPFQDSVMDRELRIINHHLDRGEALEGFARGFFSPPRPVDWQLAAMGLKSPLLIAATPHRMLLFELESRLIPSKVCFVEYDAIGSLQPPKPGVLGTSRRMRFSLHSGKQYQMSFSGPLLDEELMRQEQRLAAYLRGLAPRFSPGAKEAA